MNTSSTSSGAEEVTLRSQFDSEDRFEDVEFGNNSAAAPPPVLAPRPAGATPAGKTRFGLPQLRPIKVDPAKETQTESLLGAARLRPSHAENIAVAERATSAPPGGLARHTSYSISQSPGYIDFNLRQGSIFGKPSSPRAVLNVTAAAGSTPADAALEADLPLSDGPGQPLPQPAQPAARHRFQRLGEKLQDIMMQRFFVMLLLLVAAIVVALFFAVLLFIDSRDSSEGGCLTSIAATGAVAKGPSVVLHGIANPALTVCLGEDSGTGPWVSEDSLQALLAAHGEVYTRARGSLTFGLPASSARWSVQLELEAVKIGGNGTWAELQVGSWYAPPRTAYPGSDEFTAVYGADAVLASPLFVFKLKAEEDEMMVPSSEDRK